MLPFATPQLVAFKQGKTYPQFQAALAARATGATLAWSATPANGVYTVTTAAAAGFMTGTSWGPSSSNGFRKNSSTVSRAVQHGFVAQAAFDACVAAGYDVGIRLVEFGTYSSHIATDRNGYLSGGYNPGGDFQTSVRMTELIYWDGIQAWTVDPSNGTGSTLWTF